MIHRSQIRTNADKYNLDMVDFLKGYMNNFTELEKEAAAWAMLEISKMNWNDLPDFYIYALGFCVGYKKEAIAAQDLGAVALINSLESAIRRTPLDLCCLAKMLRRGGQPTPDIRVSVTVQMPENETKGIEPV